MSAPFGLAFPSTIGCSAESLPSNLTVYSLCVFLPSAFIPSVTTFIPPATGSIFCMLLLGPGPGLNFDLAGFSFQVPEKLSAPYTIVADSARAATQTSETTNSLDLMSHLHSWCSTAYDGTRESARFASGRIVSAANRGFTAHCPQRRST